VLRAKPNPCQFYIKIVYACHILFSSMVRFHTNYQICLPG